MSDTDTSPSGLTLPRETRRCAACGNEHMRAVSARWSGSGHEIVYRCPQCSHEIRFVPHGQLGWETTISLIAALIVSLFLWSMRWPSPLAWVFFPGLVALWLGYLAWRWSRVIRYPITGELAGAPAGDVENADPEDPLQSGIVQIEKRGFLGGLLTPIVIIVVVMGTATLIGLANHDWSTGTLW